MMKYRILYIAIVLLTLITPGCRKGDQPTSVKPGKKLKGDNVLLITLDTTRADRIGCYGHKKAATPALDALASRGTLFEQAFSQANLTLPSHCSIMTGRYPREFGVYVNGRNAMGDAHATLATLFKDHGYETGAFVASFVLDSRYGLNRGFDLYEDDMEGATFEKQPLEWQIPGDVVTDRALTWLETKKNLRFFCWVHYYDPHDPHKPPEEFGYDNERPYDGEIAFMDTQIKRLTDWLSSSGLTDRTLVVVVGDHGESFGEHGEVGHTNFIYETNLHVPYIFVHPRVILSSRRVSAIVELVDVFPTILDLFGWELPQPLYSRSLTSAFVGEDLESLPSYAESQYVYNSFGWAEQRSLTTTRWKYISSTKPELYERQNDPGEQKNLIDDKPEIARNMLDALQSRYAEIVPGEISTSVADVQVLKALESLGYASTGAQSDEFLTPELLDPKDMLKVLLKYKMAREIIKGSDIPEEYAWAIPLLESIIEESPKSTVFHFTLGKCYLSIEEPELAFEHLDQAFKLDSTYVQALVSMGDALLMMNKPDEALKRFETAYELDAHNPEVCARLAELKHEEGKLDEAIQYYRQALEDWPNMMMAHARLGKLLLNKKDYSGALQHYQEAVRIKPDRVDNQYNLGSLLFHLGRMTQAIPYLREAVRMQSNHGKALTNLAIALHSVGENDEAEEMFRRALPIEEVSAQAHFNYGLLLFRKGEKQKAVTHYKKSIQRDPSFEQPYSEIIAYYLGQKSYELAVRVMKYGVQNIPNSVRIVNTLAKLLSTCHEDRIRDGAQAVLFAQKAADLSGHKHPAVLGTLACAYAETGDFEKAIEISGQAIELAEASGQSALVDVLRAQQQGYREGHPHRNQEF